MNNSSIHQTLVEIEQNLKNLQSAREQVNAVTMSSQKLTETVSSLAKNFKTIEADFIKGTKEFADKVENEFERFQTNLDSGAKNAIHQSSEINKKHGVEIDKTINKLNELSQAVTQLEKNISGFDLDSKLSLINQSIYKFDFELQDFRKDIKSLPSLVKSLTEIQMKEQQKLSENLNKKYDSIKSGIEFIQISVVVAALILGVLILAF